MNMCKTMQFWMNYSQSFFVLLFFRNALAQYYFKNAEDKELCERSEFLELSPYRVVALAKMPWQSAHACCKMRGRLLHTIERSMESEHYPLQLVLSEKFGIDAEYLQFWIGLSYYKKHFQWTFGTSFPHSHQKIFQEIYRWVDGQPKTSPTKRCVAISPHKNELEMRTIWCNLKLNFICQKVSRIGGEPLSGQDMMTVGSSKFIDIPDFANLKFSTVLTRWPVANKICQSRNWVLIDRVHERYGDNLATTISGNTEYMFNETNKAIHSSGNNFCEHDKWHWACGERQFGNIPWLENTTTRAPEQFGSDGRCLQYVLLPKSNAATTNWTLVANNVGCNEFGYTICDTAPSCATNDQYPCMQKGPHFIDVENYEIEEKEQCKKSKFHPLKAVNGSNGISYWASLTKFTWLGANNCCKSRGWQTASPKSLNEIASFQNVLLSLFTSHLCKNEEICDGFWTSTTTLGYLPHSPLRFEDGKILSRSLYSLIRADGFSYPSCGRINFMDYQESQIKYVHADCLEKNVIVCEEIKVQQGHNVIGRKILNGYNLNSINDFEQSMWENYFEPPTEQELRRRVRNRDRDACHIANIHDQYSANCPNSAIKIDPLLEQPDKSDEEPRVTANKPIPFQTKILLEELVENAIQETDETENLDAYAFQFLGLSVNLFSDLCPMVPRRFLENALQLFCKFHLALIPKRKPEIISNVNFDWTMRLLTQCNEQLKPVQIRQDRCGDMIMSEKSCTENFICTEKRFEFNFRNTDLLLDIIWKVFEAIHAVCFPAFKQNPMLHHKYAMVITDLWENEEIRRRWSHQSEKKSVWRRLLGPYFEEHILNMERCNTATISNSYFHVRLPRTSVPRSVRMSGFSYETLQNA